MNDEPTQPDAGTGVRGGQFVAGFEDEDGEHAARPPIQLQLGSRPVVHVPPAAALAPAPAPGPAPSPAAAAVRTLSTGDEEEPGEVASRRSEHGGVEASESVSVVFKKAIMRAVQRTIEDPAAAPDKFRFCLRPQCTDCDSGYLHEHTDPRRRAANALQLYGTQNRLERQLLRIADDVDL